MIFNIRYLDTDKYLYIKVEHNEITINLGVHNKTEAKDLLTELQAAVGTIEAFLSDPKE